MTNPIDAKRALLEDVATDVSAWASKKPGPHGLEATRFVGMAHEVLDLFARTGSPIHIETATGLVGMALAYRSVTKTLPLKFAILKAREWLKGELAETAKAAQEAANPKAWSEPPEHTEESA